MNEDIKFYIYKITNLINNKVYIGKTIDIKKRWKTHKYNSKKPHLDCWAGEPSNSYICSIQLLGDEKAQTIEQLTHIGPTRLPIKKIDNYDIFNSYDSLTYGYLTRSHLLDVTWLL